MQEPMITGSGVVLRRTDMERLTHRKPDGTVVPVVNCRVSKLSEIYNRHKGNNPRGGRGSTMEGAEMKEYVDKSAIIPALENGWEPINPELPMTLELAQIAETVQNMPNADVVEVMRGHWINIGDYDMAECSECGEVFDVADQYAEPTKQDFKEFCKSYRYCPNCGCRMDLKEDDHEVG